VISAELSRETALKWVVRRLQGEERGAKGCFQRPLLGSVIGKIPQECGGSKGRLYRNVEGLEEDTDPKIRFP